MVDHIPLDESRLAATLCEAMCNGIYWVLLYHCTETLVERSKARQESLFRPIFFTSWALFICITGHLVIDIIELFKAFTPQSKKPYCVDANALSPSQSFYLGLDYWTNVTNSAFYITTIMIGDGFLIYRLYIVWSRNRFIIIPPIMFSSGVLATGIMVTYLFSEARAPVFVVASKWITAFFVLTFVCNLYSTFLIGLKIYLSQRRVKNSISFGAGFGKVLEILIESAALYCFIVMLTVAFLLSDTNLLYISTAMVTPLTGIIFCMIVTRTQYSTSTSMLTTYHQQRSGEMGQRCMPRISSSNRVRGEEKQPKAMQGMSERITTDAPEGSSVRSEPDFILHGGIIVETHREQV